MQELLESLDSIESSNSATASEPLLQKASLAFLQLKALQRRLFRQKEAAEEALAKDRRELQRQELVLANAEYQQQCLHSQLATLRDIPTPSLVRMARDELNLLPPAPAPKSLSVSKNNTTATDAPAAATPAADAAAADMGHANDETVLKEFFGKDMDTSPEAVTKKLHEELNARGNLERDLKQGQQQLAALQSNTTERRNFLNDMPKKLDIMERASQPLQKFFQLNRRKEDNATTNGDTDMDNSNRYLDRISSERAKRLETAKTLPGPLHALFCQLQVCLDRVSHDDNPRNSGVTVDAVQQKKVVLSFPIPDTQSPTTAASATNTKTTMPTKTTTTLASSKSKRVAIEFSYVPQHAVVVARAVSGDTNKLDASLLLSELFPGDTGDYWAVADPERTSGESTSEKDKDNAMQDEDETAPIQAVVLAEREKVYRAKLQKIMDSIPGKPYHWCNYIAGVHLSALLTTTDGADGTIHFSTRAVLAALQSRIVSVATLTQTLHHLEKKKSFPSSLPSNVSEWIATANTNGTNSGASIRIQSFARKDKTGPYKVVLKHKLSTLRASVRIHSGLYPSIQPEWSLQDLDTASSGGALYDSVLGGIEQRLNNVVETNAVPQVDGSGASDGSVENWILLYQLQLCMSLWEATFQ